MEGCWETSFPRENHSSRILGWLAILHIRTTRQRAWWSRTKKSYWRDVENKVEVMNLFTHFIGKFCASLIKYSLYQQKLPQILERKEEIKEIDNSCIFICNITCAYINNLKKKLNQSNFCEHFVLLNLPLLVGFLFWCLVTLWEVCHRKHLNKRECREC